MSAQTAGVYRDYLPFEANYTQIPNTWLRDSRISLKAKGLLGYLMSHEAGYEITLDRIQRDTKDGRAAIQSAAKELVTAGYLTVTRTRNADNSYGRTRWELTDPFTQENTPQADFPPMGFPPMENRTTKENKLKENKLKNLNTPEFLEFWSKYPRKTGKQAAADALARATKDTDAQVILTAVDQYSKDPNLPELEYVPHPATWLNQRRWEDGPLPKRLKPVNEDPEVRQRRLEAEAELRHLERERLHREEEALRALAVPPPLCEHNRAVVLCVKCLKKEKENENGSN